MFIRLEDLEVGPSWPHPQGQGGRVIPSGPHHPQFLRGQGYLLH